MPIAARPQQPVGPAPFRRLPNRRVVFHSISCDTLNNCMLQIAYIVTECGIKRSLQELQARNREKVGWLWSVVASYGPALCSF